jgi:Na+-translocating ferredoxin:NAD+ oxidoreductase subunit G
MAKLTSSFKNMLASLLGITLIASTTLGVVNELTKDAIATTNANKQAQAIAMVLPKFDHLGESYKVKPTDGNDSIEVFPALNAEGAVVANAVKTYTNSGFSGYIEIMAGFDAEGTITGFKVLKHAETPGLGSKMDAWFSDASKEAQTIIGKNPKSTKMLVKKDGGDLDAITAATISSRAFLDAINRAYSVLESSYDAATSATKQVKEVEE